MILTARQRQWLAGALGVGLIALLLLLAALDNRFTAEARPPPPSRKVELYRPPPPPPPPARPSDARSGSTGTQLTLESRREPVALDVMTLDVQFAAAEIGELELGGLGLGVGVGDGVGDGAGSGFGLTMLSELDQEPTVVSAPVFVYPKQAVDRGIAEFDLQFHIVIDEEGRVYPLGLVFNPFPELTPAFLEYASRVRFTPPTRLGIPVRTEYVWPIRIKR